MDTFTLQDYHRLVKNKLFEQKRVGIVAEKELISRVIGANQFSETTPIVLFRLLEHRNGENGLCCPSVSTLAMYLFPGMNLDAAINKVTRSIKELREAGVIRSWQFNINERSYYDFDFGWGLKTVSTSLKRKDIIGKREKYLAAGGKFRGRKKWSDERKQAARDLKSSKVRDYVNTPRGDYVNAEGDYVNTPSGDYVNGSNLSNTTCLKHLLNKQASENEIIKSADKELEEAFASLNTRCRY